MVESAGWTGPGFGACVNAATACRAFKSTCRHVLLTFEHHRVLAALDADEADELLAWCAAPLSNGAKRAKTVAQLQEERRTNLREHRSAWGERNLVAQRKRQ